MVFLSLPSAIDHIEQDGHVDELYRCPFFILSPGEVSAPSASWYATVEAVVSRTARGAGVMQAPSSRTLFFFRDFYDVSSASFS